MSRANTYQQANEPPAIDSGVYVLWLYLPTSSRIKIGRLGVFFFQSGMYSYAGSAQRNLCARLRRHRRAIKPLRWHIDYLRRHGRYLGEDVYAMGKEGECLLTQRILETKECYRPVKGFGSSDCRCLSHLLYHPKGLEDGARLAQERVRL